MTFRMPTTTTLHARRPRTHRAALILEDLEGRLVLNAAAPSIAAGAGAEVQVPVKPTINSLVQLTNFQITNITNQAGQLVASATATLDVLGKTVTETLNNIPLTATGSPAASPSTCDVLNLSVGPVNLDLLGLDVSLNNCANGPVTVSITGSNTGALGTLVCDIAGALNNGGALGSILGGLSTSQLSTLESGLTGILNGVLGNVLSSGGGGTTATATASANASTTASPGATTILNLDIPQGLHLDLLGLNVDTSAICLDVTAQPGNGNLLGNLLSSVSNLLNNNGNNLHAISVLERNILSTLGRLGL